MPEHAPAPTISEEQRWFVRPDHVEQLRIFRPNSCLAALEMLPRDPTLLRSAPQACFIIPHPQALSVCCIVFCCGSSPAVYSCYSHVLCFCAMPVELSRAAFAVLFWTYLSNVQGCLAPAAGSSSVR